ncbi:MAG: anthranilate phosphoribosyltransferase, partial [Actinomycetota bacterium]|nr:anthranilate phosphoribosyltransferase [Actinomycetota bacterium]
MAGVLQARGVERAFVVYGHDGLDEITTTTTSTVVEVRDGESRTYDIDPSDLGLTLADPVALLGGDASTNADLARRVLDGKRGPQRDFVLLNAAAGIVVAGLADDLAEGLEAAAASIDDGRAGTVLERMVKVSQEHATPAA